MKTSYLKRYIAFFIWAEVSLIAMAGNSYRTDLLERMATAMNITARIDTLSEGIHYRHLIYNNRRITVIVKNHEVSHIGFSVFTPSVRKALNPSVCDFLERYSLEITLPLKRERSVTRQLDEDGIFFRNGDLAFFRQLENDTTYVVSIENLNGKRYSVSWIKEGKKAFSVNFPVEYDLLNGSEMLENERRIILDIPKYSKDVRDYQLPDSSLLKLSSWQKRYYVLQGDYYYSKQLNTNLYFEKAGINSYKLFYNANFVQESLTNLMTTCAIVNDYDLQIRMVKYDFSQDTLVVKLNQWLNYCESQGCFGYFGVNAIEKGMADCVLIMRNPDMGYIHSMRMLIDVSTLEDRKGLIIARLNSYIPMARVMYLFDELKQ